jgi:Spy/CpxP family protein refolding chaperone
MQIMTSTITRLVAASALSLLALSSAAFAQTAPTPAPMEAPAATAVSSPEDCLKAAFDIAQTAEDKKLADDQLSKIEDLLTKLESHCDAKQFSEAASVGSDLKALIQKQ